MQTDGICLKCKAPILVMTEKNQLFCGICLKDMNDRIKAKLTEMGKDTKGKEFVEVGVGGGDESEGG